MKKIIAVNAGPRKGWNTDQLIQAAAEGARDAGAEVEVIDLFRLEKYTGCISCFGCKRQETYGKCVCQDGLTPVLNKIREADGLILGSPNYLSNMTASFRALYERLVFQVLTYNLEQPCCAQKKIPVLLIMTSNCAEEMYDAMGYAALLESYRNTLDRFVGETKVLTCGNTVQVKDYSQFNWTMFDPAAKQQHREETFSHTLENARQMGAALVEG